MGTAYIFKSFSASLIRYDKYLIQTEKDGKKYK